MDRKTPNQWKDEDTIYVEELKYVLAALKAVYYSHKFSLVQEHKQMCKLIQDDIDHYKKEIEFITKSVEAMK